jgi:hypothetical protein
MKSATYFLLFFSFFSGSIVWVYWRVLYSALILKCRFQILSIQDEVRLAVFDKRINHESRAYAEFEYFLNLASVVIKSPEVLGLPHPEPELYQVEAISQRIEHITKGEKDLCEAFERLSRWMFAIQIAVSPMKVLFITALIIWSIFSDWARNTVQKEKREVYAYVDGLTA